jgi:hypothetical protein
VTKVIGTRLPLLYLREDEGGARNEPELVRRNVMSAIAEKTVRELAAVVASPWNASAARGKSI